MNKIVRRIYTERVNVRKRIRAVYSLFLGKDSDSRLAKMVFYATLVKGNKNHEKLIKTMIELAEMTEKCHRSIFYVCLTSIDKQTLGNPPFLLSIEFTALDLTLMPLRSARRGLFSSRVPQT